MKEQQGLELLHPAAQVAAIIIIGIVVIFFFLCVTDNIKHFKRKP